MPKAQKEAVRAHRSETLRHSGNLPQMTRHLLTFGNNRPNARAIRGVPESVLLHENQISRSFFHPFTNCCYQHTTFLKIVQLQFCYRRQRPVGEDASLCGNGVDTLGESAVIVTGGAGEGNENSLIRQEDHHLGLVHGNTVQGEAVGVLDRVLAADLDRLKAVAFNVPEQGGVGRLKDLLGIIAGRIRPGKSKGDIIRIVGVLGPISDGVAPLSSTVKPSGSSRETPSKVYLLAEPPQAARHRSRSSAVESANSFFAFIVSS